MDLENKDDRIIYNVPHKNNLRKIIPIAYQLLYHTVGYIADEEKDIHLYIFIYKYYYIFTIQ
ncbi:hypothetical protein BEI02_10475 [Elizabethkingia sp. HvH-WGS333]|nr:hypothetical protein BEI02_10475 [Elizabethkingia sp. HvH-WGS333]